MSLLATPAAAQSCLPDGDVTQDGTITPADALQVFQHFLGIANPLLDACRQSRANVLDPASSEITPADALCIFRRFLALPSCLDALGTAARLLEVAGNNQRGQPGEVLPEPLVVRVEDQFGNPLVGVPVTFTRLLGDGEFVESAEALLSTRSHGLVKQSGLPLQAQATPPEVRRTVFTASDGTASVRYRSGQEPLQVVAAQAQEAPNQVIFSITLGPLAGNGIQPVNIALGGGRGYTANSGTNNVSVFDATGQSGDVVEVINLTRIRTAFGAGGILGLAVNTLVNRLYVYGLVDDGAGRSVVLLVVDTTSNALVEPTDPDGDTRPASPCSPRQHPDLQP